MPLSAMGVGRGRGRSNRAVGMSGGARVDRPVLLEFRTGKGSAEVGPLGVRRDACPHALLAEFRIGKRAGRARVRSATPSRWSFVLLQSETAGAPCGLFCKRCGVFKGIPSLCKCYNACKVWYRCLVFHRKCNVRCV